MIMCLLGFDLVFVLIFDWIFELGKNQPFSLPIFISLNSILNSVGVYLIILFGTKYARYLYWIINVYTNNAIIIIIYLQQLIY